VQIPNTVQSRSLAPLLHGGKEPVYEYVTGYYAGTQRTIRSGDWKLIYYPHLEKTQLFNLRADADELHDLADSPAQRETAQRLRNQLDRWCSDHGDSFRQAPATNAPKD